MSAEQISHEHYWTDYWTDSFDDETAWHCASCGLTMYPGGEFDPAPDDRYAILLAAVRAFVNTSYPNNGGDTATLTWTVPERAFGDLRRAIDRADLAAPRSVETAGLDVERLARVLHSQPHHYRGGADDALARIACTQMSGPSNCERKAVSIARAYAALSPDTTETP